MKRFFLPLALGSFSLVITSCTEYVSDSGPPSSSGRHANPSPIGPFPDYAGYAGPRPTNETKGSQNFYGGPRDWYNTGFKTGKADRLSHQSEDYRRHPELFDEHTVREFARGYDDGYVGKSH